MTAPLKRRWFRFGLRTMFVVVTVLAIPLGWLVWQMQIVRERKAVLKDLQAKASPAEVVDYIGLETHERDPELLQLMNGANFDYARVSAIRRRLGDETCAVLAVPESFDAKLIDRMERAFPEAYLAVTEAGDASIETASRESLFKPIAERKPNKGTVFKTGLIEK
jgi:hypothetical protein